VPALNPGVESKSSAAVADGIDMATTEGSQTDPGFRALATADSDRVCPDRYELSKFAITRVTPSM